MSIRIQSITQLRKSTLKKADTAENMFFTLFFTVISMMLSAAFAEKSP